MGRERVFSREMISDGRYLDLSSDRVRLAYLHMRLVCSDDGLIQLSPSFLRVTVYGGKHLSNRKIDTDLQELEAKGFLARYDGSDKVPYGCMVRIHEQTMCSYPLLSSYPRPPLELFEMFPAYRDYFLEIVKRRRDNEERRRFAKTKKQGGDRGSLFPDSLSVDH